MLYYLINPFTNMYLCRKTLQDNIISWSVRKESSFFSFEEFVTLSKNNKLKKHYSHLKVIISSINHKEEIKEI